LGVKINNFGDRFTIGENWSTIDAHLTKEACDASQGNALFLSKSTVYRNVQAAGQAAQRLRRAWLRQGRKIRVIGADLTRVQCQGESLVIGVVVDDVTGIELSVDILDDESADSQVAWLREIADLVGAEVLVSDDADTFKITADELGLDQQICRPHVTRNVLDKVAELATQALENPDPVPPQMTLSPEQLAVHLESVQCIIGCRGCCDADRRDQPGPPVGLCRTGDVAADR
jgi:hypothetical protein